ncbi:uncharacterized protein [Cicer arietinum]|uniref:uncharacterized protein isoform X2 n=1 Tax=Cicer arietinum TaxID=3827 RepID=UPI003CC6430E
MKKGKEYKRRLESLIELDKISETRVQDVAWLCSLSQSEIDMLISLKLLISKRATKIGCKKLADQFDLKMLRGIGCLWCMLDCVMPRLSHYCIDKMNCWRMNVVISIAPTLLIECMSCICFDGKSQSRDKRLISYTRYGEIF